MSFFLCPKIEKFYLPNEKKWIKACDINSTHKFLRNGIEYISIVSAERIDQAVDIYDICVKNYHNFCVTPLDIRVHNFAPAIFIGFAWAFGGGVLEFTGMSIGLAAFGGILGFKIFQKDKSSRSQIQVGPPTANQAPEDPDKDKKERKKNTITKTEFFQKINGEYEYWKDGIYKKKEGLKELIKQNILNGIIHIAMWKLMIEHIDI